MKHTIRHIAIPSLLFALATAGFSAAASDDSGLVPFPLAADPQAIAALIPAPPADESPAGMADLETMIQVQRDRTPAQIARAAKVASQTRMSPGAWVFGPEFTEQNLPRTAELLHRATLAHRPVLNAAKARWERSRPHQRDSAIQPGVRVPRDSAYPSGHSAGAALWAAFYSAAMPGYRDQFEEYVREAMWCRVLGGAHFPSDTLAGRQLGRLSAAEILKSPEAQAAVAEIRAEILAFLKKQEP